MINRIKKAAGAESLGQLINIVSLLLLTPLFVKSWDSQYYGEWLVVSAFVSTFTLLEMGLQTFVINELTKYYTTQKYNEYNLMLSNTLKLFLFIGVFGLLVFIIFLSTISLKDILNIVSLSDNYFFILFILLAMQIFFNFTYGLIVSLYKTFMQYYITFYLDNFRRIIFLLSAIVILTNGGGMIEIAIAQLVTFILVFIYAIYDIHRKHPELRFLSNESSLLKGLAYFKESSYFLLIRLSTALSVQGSVLLVSFFLTPIIVVQFTIFRTLANIIRQVIGIVDKLFWTEITVVYAKKDTQMLENIFEILNRLTWFISGSFLLILYFYGKEYIQIWMGESYEFDITIFFIILIQLFFQVLWLPSSIFLAATNNHKQLSLVYFITAFMAIVLAIVLESLNIDYLNKYGIFIGFVSAEIILPMWYIPRLTAKLLNIDVYRNFLIPLLRIVLFYMFMFFLLKNTLFFHENIFYTIFNSIIHVVIIIVFGILSLLSKQEKRRLYNEVFNYTKSDS